MSERPTGAVTFLFTDIEGSTRRWEADADSMRDALRAHDEVLRSAIEAGDGWLFKHTGDGVCAAFESPASAIESAIRAQRQLQLPVRMGVATGEVQRRDGDYFGPALNRASRVMSAGHGGQILVADSTARSVRDISLVDLGEHRLRDLPGAMRLFQVRAKGLISEFAPLRVPDIAPGNLPAQPTTFVGRKDQVDELTDLVRMQRLVTLTGVGGVGKTRLASEVAARLSGDFADGVWLVELAPVGDPAAVPEAVATAFGVTAQAGTSLTENLVEALSGRRLLVLLDNCEHVIDAAAAVVEQLLERTSSVQVLATSREGLMVGGEHQWVVPSLETGAGPDSTAIRLFDDRARSVNAGFSLLESIDAVSEICERLDGIALGIELAAARMVSMTAEDVCERLDDRFRLLAGGRRGLERHQTLRHAVGWSFDLLDSEEREVLSRCSVFAGGFDLQAVASLNAGIDEFAVLDILDSLVRKSLVVVSHRGGHARYGMLETIRQYAEDELAASGLMLEARDQHAGYYAGEAESWWERWDGPDYDAATEWVHAEFANLRTGFRWAGGRKDQLTAASIAAHTAMLGFALQRFEPVGWAEEILPEVAPDSAQLPRLCLAAGFCMFTGRVEAAFDHLERAVALEAEHGRESFEPGWAHHWEAFAHFYSGRFDRAVELAGALAARDGAAGVYGAGILAVFLSYAGRENEAIEVARAAVPAARRHANPWFLAYALLADGIASADSDPAAALQAYREGRECTTVHRVPFLEGATSFRLAVLEAAHGDASQALDLFSSGLDSFLQAGNRPQLAIALAHLTVFFDRSQQPAVAATLYGGTTHHPVAIAVAHLAAVVEGLRSTLGDAEFDRCSDAGAAMDAGEIVAYAQRHIGAIP